MRKHFGAYLQMGTAMAIVRSNVVVGKLVTTNFPVFLASAMRFGLASLIFLVILLKVHGRLPLIQKKDLLTMFVQSFFGNFLFNIFVLYGLRLTSAVESGIIISTTPVAVGIISYFFLRERLTRVRIISIFLVAFGLTIINVFSGISPQGARGANPLLGDILIGGSVLGESLWIILGKSVAERIKPLTLSSIACFFGFIMALPFGLYEAAHFHFSTLSLLNWMPIIYFGIIGTVAAYLLWYRGAEKVPASTAGTFAGISPISSALLSFLLLGEPLMWFHIIGMLCVIPAILLTERDSSSNRRHKQDFDY
jgi:drug/metabolite transporter (DMT)-like permease